MKMFKISSETILLMKLLKLILFKFIEIKKNCSTLEPATTKVDNFENFYKFELCNTDVTNSSNICIQ